MAYALALKSRTDLATMGPVILIDTLIYSLFSILGIGSILNPVMERLGVKRKDEEELAINALIEEEDRPQNLF